MPFGKEEIERAHGTAHELELLRARIEVLQDIAASSVELTALERNAHRQFQEIIKLSPALPDQGFQYSVTTLGRLDDPAQFENIVVRADGNRRNYRFKQLNPDMDVYRVLGGAAQAPQCNVAARRQSLGHGWSPEHSGSKHSTYRPSLHLGNVGSGNRHMDDSGEHYNLSQLSLDCAALA